MAGTRGLAKFKGSQLNGKIMRNYHFDENNKISEIYLDIDFNSHREILEDTKIEVFSQVNNVVVAGQSEIDITSELGGKPAAISPTEEGVVIGKRVDLRKTGTEDFPLIDDDGDRVYGRIEFDTGTFTLKFYSIQGGIETPYTFANDSPNVDFRYVIRTNMSVIPVDAIVNGGSGFVEGATDANAYMNLVQLMKDIYGATGHLDNDGNANLAKSIVEQIADEINARTQADLQMLDDFASTDSGKGADLIGVVVDPSGNYVGTTVQEVLTELAQKLADTSTDLDDRVTKLEIEEEEEVYEATGGETQYMLTKGVAKPKSVLLFINGQLQAPGINFEYITDGSGNITGFSFAPDTLEVVNNVPDVLYVKYKKVL